MQKYLISLLFVFSVAAQPNRVPGPVIVSSTGVGRLAADQEWTGANLFSGTTRVENALNVSGNLTVGGTISGNGVITTATNTTIRIGHNAMPNLGSGGLYNYPGANVAIGQDAAASCVEGGVVAVGWQAAMSAGAVGDDSAVTAVGWQALKNTTTGHATAFGWAAGRNNTTGHIATFGDESSGLNTTGITACLGYYAGYGNTTGKVTAVGYLAAKDIGPGTTMTVVGQQAGYKNTSASLTAMGYQAAFNNTNGTYSSAFGDSALYSAQDGGANSAFGYASLFNNTTGFDNSAFGRRSGRSITTGYYNSFFGSDAGYNSGQKVDVINSTAIGCGTYTTADNQVVIGNSSVTSTELRGTVRVSALVVTNNLTVGGTITMPTNMTAGASWVPTSGNMVFVASNSVIYAVTATKTNLWLNCN